MAVVALGFVLLTALKIISQKTVSRKGRMKRRTPMDHIRNLRSLVPTLLETTWAVGTSGLATIATAAGRMGSHDPIER